MYRFGLENLWIKFLFRFAYSNLFAGLPLEAEGGSFSPRLSLCCCCCLLLRCSLQCLMASWTSKHVTGPMPNQCATLWWVKAIIYSFNLIGCLSKDNSCQDRLICCKLSVWMQPAKSCDARLSKCTPNLTYMTLTHWWTSLAFSCS